MLQSRGIADAVRTMSCVLDGEIVLPRARRSVQVLRRSAVPPRVAVLHRVRCANDWRRGPSRSTAARAEAPAARDDRRRRTRRRRDLVPRSHRRPRRRAVWSRDLEGVVAKWKHRRHTDGQTTSKSTNELLRLVHLTHYSNQDFGKRSIGTPCVSRNPSGQSWSYLTRASFVSRRRPVGDHNTAEVKTQTLADRRRSRSQGKARPTSLRSRTPWPRAVPSVEQLAHGDPTSLRVQSRYGSIAPMKSTSTVHRLEGAVMTRARVGDGQTALGYGSVGRGSASNLAQNVSPGVATT